LEQTRRRQRAAEVQATGRVLAVEVQAMLLYRFAPQKARHLLRQTRDAIYTNPEIGAPCRDTLLRLLAPLLLFDPSELEQLLGYPLRDNLGA
jgi:hypothetical protein